VPMQDGRQMQLPELLELHPQGSAGELELRRHLHEITQRGTFERNRMAPAQRVQVGLPAVIGGDHCQARQPAFRGLRLPDQWKLRMPGEVQHRCVVLYIRVLRRGSSSQDMSERFSSSTSALSNMCGCKAIFWP